MILSSILRPGPAPGDRRAPTVGRFPRARRPDPAPRKRGRGHRSRLGTRERAESRLAAEGVTRRTERRARTPTARRPPRPNPLGRQGPARRDPPPTQKGEARATVGDEPRSATTAVAGGNPRSPPRTPSRGKGRRVLCERVATAALPSRRQRQRRQSGGSGTPRHTSRIAREGFLTEGGSHSPTRQPPLLGPAEAPRDAWGREGACSTRKHLRAATLSVRGQGGGPAGARVRATPRGPPVHPPPSFRGKAPPKSTHTQPVGGRTAAPRRPAGARATGPNPPRSLTRPARTRQRGARDVRSPDQADALPRVGGARLVSLDRLEPHTDELPQDPRADTAAATGGGGAGGGNDTPPLGLGHLRDNPERSRSTAKAQAEPTLAHTPREGSTTGRRDGTPHRRGGGPPASPQPLEATARGACRVRGPRRPAPRRRRQRAGRRGRAGLRTPHASPTRATRRRGEERRGDPAGRSEKNGPVRHERPPLARRGSDPARESTTSPHRSRRAPRERRSAGRPTPCSGEGAADNPAETRTPDTHGTEPAGWGCRGRPGRPQRRAHGGRVALAAFPAAPRRVRDPDPGRHRESGHARARERTAGPRAPAGGSSRSTAG